MAPVCGSWTRISRGSSLRSSINCFGDMTREFVATANLMISRPIHFISYVHISLGLVMQSYMHICMIYIDIYIYIYIYIYIVYI